MKYKPKNEYAKFEYKGMQPVGIIDCRHHQLVNILDGKMSIFNTPKTNKYS